MKDIMGEFLYDGLHGYSYRGLHWNTMMHQHHHIDFNSFIQDLSDNGVALMARPFTDTEKTYLLVKYGYPMLPNQEAEKYFLANKW